MNVEDKESSKNNETIEEDEIMQDNTFTYSNEGYKNEKILEEKFDSIDNPWDENKNEKDLSLFERKDKAKELFKMRQQNKNIPIEEILSYDNTNKNIQLEYLALIVDCLLKEEDSNRIPILIEKINKASIICDEKDYNQIIEVLPDKYQTKVAYINFKKNLINSLKLIIEKKNEKDLDDVYIFKSFNFQKKYEFNQDCEMGENNYYFYCLIFQIIISNLQGKITHIKIYEKYILKLIYFLETKDFSNLEEADITYFEFLFNILIENNIITNEFEKIGLIDNYLKSYENHKKEEKKNKSSSNK